MVNEEMTAVKSENGKGREFDRQEWIRQKRAERESAFRMMDEMADLVKSDPKDLKNYLDLQVRFPGYSVGNLLLIAAQKPQAKELRSFEKWKEYGVSVKKGETGILLLEPGSEYTRKDGSTGVSYNIRRVFDITQTGALRNFMPEFPNDFRKMLSAFISIAPCQVEVDPDMSGRDGDDAVYDPEESVIRVARSNDYESILPPLIREIAKAYMSAGDGSPEYCEEIARCVSYAVCERKDISTKGISFTGLTDGFSGLSAREIRGILGRIRDVTSGIIEDYNDYFRRLNAEKEREQDMEL